MSQGMQFSSYIALKWCVHIMWSSIKKKLITHPILCMYVCVRKREREREKEGGREREREGGRVGGRGKERDFKQ